MNDPCNVNLIQEMEFSRFEKGKFCVFGDISQIQKFCGLLHFTSDFLKILKKSLVKYTDLT